MEGQAAAYFKLRQRTRSSTGSRRPRDVGRRERGRAHPADGRGEHPRAVAASSPSARRAARRAAKPLMETMMRRTAAGRVPLEPDAVPDPRLRGRGRHVARRLRGLLLPRLPVRPRRPGRGLAQAVGGDPPAGGVDHGQGGDPHRGAGHRPAAERLRPHVHRRRRPAQHARRRVLHRAGRGLGQRRGDVHATRPSTAAARSPA